MRMRAGLAVGIDLEDEGDFVLQGDSVTLDAGLSVAAVWAIEGLQSWSELIAQGFENDFGLVGRAVVDDEQGEIGNLRVEHFEPVPNHDGDGSLLVKNGHDDQELWA